MDFVRMIQEGGLGAYAAIALGGLGFLVGAFALITLAGKSRASFTLGIVTLCLAAASAGAGMGGLFYGHSQVERALAFVGPGLDRERIHRQGFKESQSAALIGFFAALLPLALGGAAAMLGSRLQAPGSRVQGFAQPAVSTDEGMGQTVVAGVFFSIAALAVGGAWVLAHGELPKLRYPFDPNDSDSWSLASALDEVKAGTPKGCERLAYALDAFWNAPDKREWPRQFRKEIPRELSDWRAAADGCAKQILDGLDGHASEWTRGGLLDSALLQDDALHTRALVEPEKETAPDAPPVIGDGVMPRELIAGGIRADLKGMRDCYERELLETPMLEGKMVVNFTIGADGKVKKAQDASVQPFPSAKVTACMLARFRDLRFPKPKGGGEVNVRYPFVFKSSK